MKLFPMYQFSDNKLQHSYLVSDIDNLISSRKACRFVRIAMYCQLNYLLVPMLLRILVIIF